MCRHPALVLRCYRLGGRDTADHQTVIPMAHAAEIGAINRLHFSIAGFWYVCHANLGPDSSCTKFRRRLEHCSKPESGIMHVTKRHCTKVHNKRSSCLNSYCLSSAMHSTWLNIKSLWCIYFRQQKFNFHFRWYEKLTPGNGVDFWCQFLQRVTWI